MARLILGARNALFGLGVLGALAFGVSQASAAPQVSDTAASCHNGHCDAYCKSIGAVFGMCRDDQVCECTFEI
ncbi:MAG TPA: hypothetical protein VHG28_24010 [Longimicrobiaceae bacterium]|nr:hypothetical protein [Longimicrobiaceae bacterium]